MIRLAGVITDRPSEHAREQLFAMLEAMWSDALWHLKLKSELKESRRGPKPRRRRLGKERKR